MATRAHLLSHGSRASLLVSRPCFSLFQLGAQSSSVARPISLSPARSSLSSPSPWFRASAPLARTQLGAIPSPCHAARFLPARPDHRSPSAWSSPPWPLPSPFSDPSSRSSLLSARASAPSARTRLQLTGPPGPELAPMAPGRAPPSPCLADPSLPCFPACQIASLLLPAELQPWLPCPARPLASPSLLPIFHGRAPLFSLRAAALPAKPLHGRAPLLARARLPEFRARAP